MGRGIGHAPATARRTESPPFTRKRQEPVEATSVAVQAKKTEFESATLEICTQLALDEARDAAVRGVGSDQERLQRCRHDLVQDRRFRTARRVVVPVRRTPRARRRSIGRGKHEHPRKRRGRWDSTKETMWVAPGTMRSSSERCVMATSIRTRLQRIGARRTGRKQDPARRGPLNVAISGSPASRVPKLLGGR